MSEIQPTTAHPCVATTAAVARYLLAIHEIARDGSRVTYANLARRIGVSTPSAHEMVGRLSELGLVTRDPLALTQDGTSAALVLSGRERAARRLAGDVLGLDDEAADAEAHVLAATLSPLLGRRLTDWAHKQDAAGGAA
ncbi:MAG: metal-dependent transcriptional regulator [Solirubrobacteraceae bacterium]|nr:metal-dependent transcriptional regulator [Solirubrobacteraceae bacterium]